MTPVGIHRPALSTCVAHKPVVLTCATPLHKGVHVTPGPSPAPSPRLHCIGDSLLASSPPACLLACVSLPCLVLLRSVAGEEALRALQRESTRLAEKVRTQTPAHTHILTQPPHHPTHSHTHPYAVTPPPHPLTHASSRSHPTPHPLTLTIARGHPTPTHHHHHPSVHP